MKMKMKMKNNKMFLALVVVAALAMVSVAGVALASDSQSDAASVDITGGMTVAVSSDNSVFVYYTSTGTIADCDGTITIPTTGSVSGTISTGLRTGTGVDADPFVYTTLNSISLTNASGLSIVVTNGEIVVDQTTTTTESTISMVKGTATFGFVAAFNGTITSTDLTVTVDNMKGVAVTYGSVSTFAGVLVAGSAPTTWTSYALDGAIATVTLSGTGYIGTTTVPANCDLIIADNTVISNETPVQTFTSNVVIALNSSEATTNVAYAVAVDSTGTATTATISTLSMTFASLKMGESYSLYIVSDLGNVFIGTMTFTAGAVVGSYTANIATSVTVATVGITTTTGAATTTDRLGTTSTTNSITYYSTSCTLVYAIDATSASHYTGSVTATGVITFSGDIVTSDNLLVILKDANGAFNVYYGAATVVAHAVTSLGAFTYGADIAVVKLTPTAITGATPSPLAVKTITNAGYMYVDGELSLNYASAVNKADIINTAGTINIGTDGKIAYQTLTGAVPITCTGTTTGIINAVGYSVAAATGSVFGYTHYYYNNLTTPMTESSTYTIYGELIITDDISLTGSSATLNTVKIGANSELIIGTSTSTADVTIPKTTTLSIDALGKITVAYGKLIFSEKTSYSDEARVFSSVKTVETDTVYTDLATALGTAVADDVITLRGNADLITAVILPVDVEVALASHTITVKAGAVFTVNGKITGTGDIVVNPAVAKTTTTAAKVAGELVINSDKVSASVTLNGTLTFPSTFDNTATTAGALPVITIGTSTTVGAPAVIIVNGSVDFETVLGGSGYVNVTITGTLVDSVAALFTGVHDVVSVTGVFSAKAAVTITDLTVTGTGSVTGTLISGTTYYVVTVGTLTVGTAATDVKENVNEATVVATVTGIATIYGTYDETDVTLSIGTAATSIFYLNTNVVYKTVIAATATTPLTATALKSPALTGLVFNGWYDAPNSGSRIIVASTNYVGTYTEIYGYTTVSTTSVTFSAVQNGTWTVNGNVVSGTTSVAYASSYSIQFLANNGYELKDVKILVNGSAMPLGYTPSTGDVLTISGSVVEKPAGPAGLSVTDILLIIMVIIIAIIAVVVILKLMRS